MAGDCVVYACISLIVINNKLKNGCKHTYKYMLKGGNQIVYQSKMIYIDI